MAGQTDNDRLENVAPGDIIALQLPDRPGDGRPYKVVHKDSSEVNATPAIIVTLEGDDGETFDAELPADTAVTRALESKWESAQSPTPHTGR
ncbi:Uncharacterised protein [Mycolicibacterium vanbaalenii]|uniref:Oxidoreductase, FAD-linked n=1 Tax=Mycolicibacterium vanbaalenii TaxID=110539 RepID=A0A5S9R9V6_MYCVN|nr:hypothetical protein [Mycolicibacterium vanbaalenii]CAA0134149.1 Uncharacterised protein [Mycolicibacterium vanbaalenii]